MSWGGNHKGVLGLRAVADDFSVTTPTVMSKPMGRVRKISSCDRHSLMLMDGGRVVSWGWNYNGQLGHGSRQSKNVPAGPLRLHNYVIVDIAVGFAHSLALADNGMVFGWGCGQVSANGLRRTSNDRYEPWFDDKMIPQRLPVFQGKGVRAIAAGGDMSMALTSAGEVFTWGAKLSQVELLGSWVPSLPAPVSWE